ncbi:uncharacterized protein LOC112901640 isoform X2 [Panicum hallii]|uniref:uncharacterized protein LOC112901640 isoform X2 n=1 Tax=Panicum hallii TaxID=206008 RepID=UPI000DF4E496|nr:uncharacterized protein LOC112901640 isoform X2 [Panicum hallii]
MMLHETLGSRTTEVSQALLAGCSRDLVAADGLAVSSGQGTDVDESGYASSEPSPHDVYADDEGCMNELTMEQGGAVVSGEGSASDTRLQSDQHQQSRHGYSEPTTRCDKQRK